VLEFLLALGVPKRQAEIDAEGIEHHVSSATLRCMRRFARGE
jgi:DtxR family manganese transport transcriptional regulator